MTKIKMEHGNRIKNERVISFDLESTGLEAQNQQITCICAVSREGTQFAQTVVPGILEEAEVIENFLAFLTVYKQNGYKLISKNGIGFDIPFIMLRAYINSLPLNDALVVNEIEHEDIQKYTSKRVGLQQMAELYGLAGKLEKGAFAPQLWYDEEYIRLQAYCLQDCKLTLDVYETFKRLNDGSETER